MLCSKKLLPCCDAVDLCFNAVTPWPAEVKRRTHSVQQYVCAVFPTVVGWNLFGWGAAIDRSDCRRPWSWFGGPPRRYYAICCTPHPIAWIAKSMQLDAGGRSDQDPPASFFVHSAQGSDDFLHAVATPGRPGRNETPGYRSGPQWPAPVDR